MESNTADSWHFVTNYSCLLTFSSICLRYLQLCLNVRVTKMFWILWTKCWFFLQCAKGQTKNAKLLSFTLQNLQRHVMSYIITYYLPSGLFVVVSWISHLIPPDIVPGISMSIYASFLKVVPIARKVMKWDFFGRFSNITKFHLNPRLYFRANGTAHYTISCLD